MTPLIIGLLITMVFSAFFSGMEIAFVSSNRLRAEMDREKNGLSQRALTVFYNHPNNFISTMLVGNNIALVVYGILFARIFDATLFSSLGDGARVTCDTLLSTIVVLFTGEFLPKTIFRSNPNGMLTFFAIPAYVCYVLLYPISRFSTLLSRGLLRLFGVRMPNETEEREFTKTDLDYLVQSSIDNATDDAQIEDEVEMFHNALDFADTKVRDCMVPRTEIEAVDVEDCTVEQLKSKFIESGHSKIIVYRGDIDHIIGYIHSSELFKHVTSIERHIQQMPYVPETMAARKLMHIFLQQKKSLGVVVDEFGGTSGIVSLEDIVEEITGDIEDEHDHNQLVEQQIGENEWEFSGRAEIDRINGKFDLNLPESEDYMTLAGLVLHELQTFPHEGDFVDLPEQKIHMVITKTSSTKIELIRVKIEK